MLGERGETLGKLLQAHRRRRGLSQDELARLVRPPLSVNTISNLERGRTRPYRHTLEGLGDALELSAEERIELTAVWHASGGADARADPPSAEVLQPPSNLPIELSSFVGREREAEELGVLLETSRLVTLVGVGGSGKSRLGLRLAARWLPVLPGGVWLVELAPVAEHRLVAQTVANILGVREAPGQALEAALVAAVGSRALLLVLDNCEHVLSACAELATELLGACPNLRVLATSREPLGVGGEAVCQVPPLSLPEASVRERATTKVALLESEAGRLFAERAREAWSGFAVAEANAPTIARICRALDGLPLAIELAAAQVRVIGVEQIAVRLTDQLGLLPARGGAAVPRHQTLRAMVDWSWELLGEPERLLFARSSVFAGGWTIDAAEAVGGLDEPAAAGSSPSTSARSAVLGLLANLVDKSLVQVEHRDDRTRYSMMEVLRQYAAERLDAMPDAPAVRAHHADHFVELAIVAGREMYRAGETAALDHLDAEHGNLRVALGWLLGCAAAGDSWAGERAVRLAGALWPYWDRRAYIGEAREWLAAALAVADSSPAGLGANLPAARARVVDGIASIARYQGDLAMARSLHEANLATWRVLGDRAGEADALCGLAIVVRYQGDHGRARSLLSECLVLRRELDDRQETANVLLILGSVAGDEGDTAAARRLLVEGIGVYRRLGAPSAVISGVHRLGVVARLEGRSDEARALFEESLELSREADYPRGVAYNLRALGGVCLTSGDEAGGRTLLAESIDLSQARGDRWDVTMAIEELAGLAARRGQAELALRLAGAVDSAREALGYRTPPSRQDQIDRLLVRATADRDASALRAAGRAMSLEDAAAEALALAREDASRVSPWARRAAGPLTRREAEVAALLGRGLRNREIAETLAISHETARQHAKRVLTKLGLHSRTEIATWVSSNDSDRIAQAARN